MFFLFTINTVSFQFAYYLKLQNNSKMRRLLKFDFFLNDELNIVHIHANKLK